MCFFVLSLFIVVDLIFIVPFFLFHGALTRNSYFKFSLGKGFSPVFSSFIYYYFDFQQWKCQRSLRKIIIFEALGMSAILLL